MGSACEQFEDCELKMVYWVNVSEQGRRSHRSWEGHDPQLFEAKGDGGNNLGIIHISILLLSRLYTNVNALSSLSWRVAHQAVNYFPTGGV